jgi:hypothetical protein
MTDEKKLKMTHADTRRVMERCLEDILKSEKRVFVPKLIYTLTCKYAVSDLAIKKRLQLLSDIGMITLTEEPQGQFAQLNEQKP